MVGIFLASDQPKLPSPDGIPSFDKIAHFGAYGLLATLWMRAFAARASRGRAALLAWIVAAAYGATDEWHQSWVPGRSIELADWIADASGAATAVFAYVSWPAYRALLERPLSRRRRAASQSSLGAALPEQQP